MKMHGSCHVRDLDVVATRGSLGRASVMIGDTPPSDPLVVTTPAPDSFRKRQG